MGDPNPVPTNSPPPPEVALGDPDAATERQIASALEDKHPADAAAFIRTLSRPRAVEILQHVEWKTTARLLRELHPTLAASLLQEIGQLRASRVLSQMQPDDRVDILHHLPAEFRDQVIRELGTRHAEEVRRLAPYPADSAGGIMTTEAISLPVSMTVEEATAELRRIGQKVEQIYYVYAIDTAGRLAGVLSTRDLIFAPPDQPLATAIRTGVVSVPVDMDQEEVARILRRHAYLALPVIDADARLLGIITADDLADVAEEEATEDIQKIGGTAALHAPYFDVGLGQMLRKRGGWLAILFLGEMLTATAMGFFEAQIHQAAMIALFVPLIISSGGNSGSQATTIIIRSLALREITPGDWWRIAARELRTGLILGLLLGVIGAVRIVLWYHSGWHDYGGHPYRMAATILASLLGVVAFGSVVGSMLPMIMHRLRLDPASASAPFVATLVDVTGLIIYFTMAVLILGGTVL